MKVWIKRSLIGVAASATLLVGAAALAHRGDGAHGFGWRAVTADETARLQAQVIERAGRLLDLDAAQKAKLATLADRVREARNSVVATSGRPRDELQAAMSGPTFDRARVNTVLQAQLSVALAQSPAVVNAAADFYDSLRPDQQAQLRERLARGRGDGRWGREAS